MRLRTTEDYANDRGFEVEFDDQIAEIGRWVEVYEDQEYFDEKTGRKLTYQQALNRAVMKKMGAHDEAKATRREYDHTDVEKDEEKRKRNESDNDGFDPEKVIDKQEFNRYEISYFREALFLKAEEKIRRLIKDQEVAEVFIKTRLNNQDLVELIPSGTNAYKNMSKKLKRWDKKIGRLLKNGEF